jgi:hypothetical protein
MILACTHCSKEVRRRPSVLCDVVCCSPECKAAILRKVKPEQLRAAALSGESIAAMSLRFGVNRATIRKWLEADGLLSDWSKRRYKKCAEAA